MFTDRCSRRAWACLLLACCACAGEHKTVYPPQAQGTAPAPAPSVPAVAAPAGPLPSVGGVALPVVNDPINSVDLSYLRGEAQSLLNELVATLPPPQQARVQGIPLVVDSTVGDVNAFAACTKGGHAAMAITDGLLDIEAHLSQAQATDETFGLHTLDAYIRLIATKQRPNQPIVQPPAGFFNPTQMVDGRKVARQHQILDEQVGFVLGHELAHHHMGNLPCTSAGQLPLAELGQVLSGSVPLFNQPNEFAADAAGTNTLLTLGYRRSGYHLSEMGALITMQFFAGLEQFTPGDLVFAFQNTHPPAVIRTPIIRQTAAAWRLTGGRGLPYLI